MLNFCTVCMRFLMGPLLVAALLVIAELARPSPQEAFWVKIGLALAGFGLGSVLPFFSSDEALYLKFATIKVRGDGRGKGGTVEMIFSKEDKKRFDFVRTLISLLFLLGMVIWAGNYFLSERLSYPLAPTPVRQFWLFGVAYCTLAGILFVYLSLDRKTNLMQDDQRILVDGGGAQLAEGSPLNTPVPEHSPEREPEEKG
jgi:hypothetical protein